VRCPHDPRVRAAGLDPDNLSIDLDSRTVRRLSRRKEHGDAGDRQQDQDTKRNQDLLLMTYPAPHGQRRSRATILDTLPTGSVVRAAELGYAQAS
jgi:hypothetical protein